MKKMEITQLFAIIRSNYSNFEVTAEKKEVWHNLMTDLSFERASENLFDYMRRSSFPPTAADIIQHDPDQHTDYERLRLETEERLLELEESRRLAIDIPEHLRQRLLLKGGEPEQ